MSLIEIPESSAIRREHWIDPWTFLDYKDRFNQPLNPKGLNSGVMIPSWVGDHQRRLTAYKILEDFSRNNARAWLATQEPDIVQSRREYGDANVVVEQYLSSLLGVDQSIVVPDAVTTNPDGTGTAFATLLAEWAELEQFQMKVVEGERNAIKLGDNVYVLGWNEKLNRPRLQVWDPGFYFPVWDDTNPEEEFPNKIHIAYEYETKENGQKRTWVRRITWELRDIIDLNTGNPMAVRLPWNGEDPASHSTKTCVLSDAVWELNQLNSNTMDDLSWPAASTIYVDNLNLNIDFIPVVHIPNTIAGQEHWGTSVLSAIMQVLDDLVSTDTDLQAASATTGSPPLILSGSSAPKNDRGQIESYGPGTVFETGDGSGTMIDTSTSLDALIKYDEKLLSRISVNGRIPEALLGRVKPNEVPSGIALTLSFTPHSGAVKQMRLVRKQKYSLILKFVGRMYWSRQKIAGISPAELAFGSFLPADKQETMTLVQLGLSSRPPAISIETAVRMLMEAGLPIDDAVGEVKRIKGQDFNGADALFTATNDLTAVRAYLNLGPPPPPQLDAQGNPIIPPPPPGPPQPPVV